ncbi:MAG: aminoacyl-tRNA hydrolase [Flammeovirgaceae bacterium]
MKYLIVGLGNIGKEYENTRHNIGFKILDNISEKLGSEFELKKYAFYSNGKFKGRNIHLIKPSNFVNNSGKAVQYWANELKIKLENIIVVTDELSLPFGKIRLKKKGSDGGHNGLKSINISLKNSNYSRLRFGIDNNFKQGFQSEYVLEEFSKEEQKELENNIELSSNIVLNFCHIGVERTMNKFN